MSRMWKYAAMALTVMLPVLALSACAGLNDHSEGLAGSDEYPVLLHASSGAGGTRISVSGTTAAWEVDDKIQITAVAADESIGMSELSWFSGVEGKDEHFASFSGFVTMTSAPQDCYFVYPVKSSTSVNPETGEITLYYNSQTGLHEPFMYAAAPYSGSGISVVLSHVGAMLEIDVRMEEVRQITFVGNRLETLSPVIVDARSGEVSFTSQSNVQITVPVQQEGKTYIAVPPVNLEKGFSLICSDEEGSRSMIRTFSSDGSLGGGCDFSKKAGHIIPVTLDGSLETYSVTASVPVAEHTKTDSGLLTGTSVRFSMDKSGVSDKAIEVWGATLLNPDGDIVRQSRYTNADPAEGQTVVMEVANNWKLLPAGTYTFTPFYEIYGQKVSLSSRSITVSDPGVRLDLHGQTSYDKYIAGNTEEANKHANTVIEGVAVSTNVDLSLIDVYSATVGGEDLGAAEITSGSEVRASYGNVSRSRFDSYIFRSSIQVGALTFSDEKTFVITGLPYEADFTDSDPRNWEPAWAFVGGTVNYDNDRVNYTNSSTEDLLGGVRSPKFHLPQDIPVRTAFDACGRNVDFSIIVAIDKAAYLDIYFTACSSTENSVKFGQNCVRAEYKVSYSESGYLDWSPNITLKQSTPSIMYSARSKLYDKALYKIKIHYSDQ